jgi:hypothetical protein
LNGNARRRRDVIIAAAVIRCCVTFAHALLAFITADVTARNR